MSQTDTTTSAKKHSNIKSLVFFDCEVSVNVLLKSA